MDSKALPPISSAPHEQVPHRLPSISNLVHTQNLPLPEAPPPHRVESSIPSRLPEPHPEYPSSQSAQLSRRESTSVSIQNQGLPRLAERYQPRYRDPHPHSDAASGSGLHITPSSVQGHSPDDSRHNETRRGTITPAQAPSVAPSFHAKSRNQYPPTLSSHLDHPSHPLASAPRASIVTQPSPLQEYDPRDAGTYSTSKHRPTSNQVPHNRQSQPDRRALPSFATAFGSHALPHFGPGYATHPAIRRSDSFDEHPPQGEIVSAPDPHRGHLSLGSDAVFHGKSDPSVLPRTPSTTSAVSLGTIQQQYEFRPAPQPRPLFTRDPRASIAHSRSLEGTQSGLAVNQGFSAPFEKPQQGVGRRPPSPTPTIHLPPPPPRTMYSKGATSTHRPQDAERQSDFRTPSLARGPGLTGMPSMHREPIPFSPTSTSRPQYGSSAVQHQPQLSSTPSLAFASQGPSQGSSPTTSTLNKAARGKGKGKYPSLALMSKNAQFEAQRDPTSLSSQPRVKRQRKDFQTEFNPELAGPPPLHHPQTMVVSDELSSPSTLPPISGTPADVNSTIIPPRPKHLIRQKCKEDLPRVIEAMRRATEIATKAGKHMKMIHHHSKIVRDFALYYVKYKPLNVPQPPQCEIEELSYRVVCIVNLCKDIIKMHQKKRAEGTTQDQDTEKAVEVLGAMPAALRQILPSSSASATPPITSLIASNSLKRSHGTMEGQNSAAPVMDESDLQIEEIRRRRLGNAPIKGKYQKRSTKLKQQQKCNACGSRDSPEWRRGPDGQRTLCNACGLHYAKMIKNQKGIWIGKGDPPPIDVLTLRQVTKIGVQPRFNEQGELEIPGYYRVPAAQAQSMIVRTSPVDIVPPLVEDKLPAPLGLADHHLGPAASQAQSLVLVDENEDLSLPAGKRRRWKSGVAHDEPMAVTSSADGPRPGPHEASTSMPRDTDSESLA